MIFFEEIKQIRVKEEEEGKNKNNSKIIIHVGGGVP